MNFKDNSNATEFLKGIRERKDLDFIRLENVTIPAELVKEVYFRSPVEDLLNGVHRSTGEIDEKMKNLKENVLKNGWIVDTQIESDRISFEWEEGRFKVCNGQHRLVLAEALEIPHLQVDITLNYDKNDQFETLTAFNLSNLIESFQPAEFNTDFAQKDLDKTQELYRIYVENKPKRKWYQIFK